MCGAGSAVQRGHAPPHVKLMRYSCNPLAVTVSSTTAIDNTVGRKAQQQMEPSASRRSCRAPVWRRRWLVTVPAGAESMCVSATLHHHSIQPTPLETRLRRATRPPTQPARSSPSCAAHPFSIRCDRHHLALSATAVRDGVERHVSGKWEAGAGAQRRLACLPASASSGDVAITTCVAAGLPATGGGGAACAASATVRATPEAAAAAKPPRTYAALGTALRSATHIQQRQHRRGAGGAAAKRARGGGAKRAAPRPRLAARRAAAGAAAARTLWGWWKAALSWRPAWEQT